MEQGREQHYQSMRLIEQCEDSERSDEDEADSSIVVGRSLERYRMMATFKKKVWTKLRRYTGKNITQLLTSQVALMESQL